MRAAAEVEPVALLVDRDLLVRRDGLHQFDLKGFAVLFEEGHGLVARPFLAHDGFVGGDDLAHFFFDRGEILGRKRLLAIKIVIKTVLDHRADGDLRARIERLHGVGEHMGGVVADQFQRTRIVPVEKLDFRVGPERRGRVHDWPSSIMATVLFASEGEMALAMSRPETPGSKARAAPSGKVTEIM